MARRPRKGDLVVVEWEDFAGSEDGEPDPPVFATPGFFVAWIDKNGVKGLHLDRSRIVAGSSDYDRGWDFYPKRAIRKIEICGVFK